MKLSDREWREATDLRPSTSALLLVLVAAALLRVWGVGQGIPFAVGVDEPEIMERAVRMMKTGDFNPHFFDYPSLYIYLQAVVATIHFLVGTLRGRWASLAQVTAADFYAWGRCVTALFGIATVWLVFQTGMRWGARHALLASTLMAVAPMHVRESHFVLTDVPLTFFVTLTLLLSIIASEKGTTRAFAWAGVAAGLSAATKYNGALALVFPLVASALTPPAHGGRARVLGAVVAACLAAFIVAAPYTILDLPAFLNGFAHLANQYRTLPAPRVAASLTYFKHLSTSFGWPALVMAVAGLILGVVRVIRGPGQVRWALVVIFPVLYFIFVSDQRIVFGRYLLPLVPCVTLLAAAAVISGVSLLRRYEIPRIVRTLLIVGLTVAAVLPPSINAVQFDRGMALVSTAELTWRWVQANVPPNAKIVVESQGLVLSAPYDSRNVPSLIQEKPSNRPLAYDDYVAGHVDYFIASSEKYGPFLANPQRYRGEFHAYMELLSRGDEVARFIPSGDHPGAEWRIVEIRKSDEIRK